LAKLDVSEERLLAAAKPEQFPPHLFDGSGEAFLYAREVVSTTRQFLINRVADECGRGFETSVSDRSLHF
jgi:hypothetical protein